MSFLNWDTEIPSVNLTAWVVPAGPHRPLATCIGEFVPSSGAPIVAHTAMPMASANSTVFVAILSPDISRRLSCVSAANLKNYAAGPEMVCPGGALSFSALGPEIPNVTCLAGTRSDSCCLTYTRSKRGADAQGLRASSSET